MRAKNIVVWEFTSGNVFYCEALRHRVVLLVNDDIAVEVFRGFDATGGETWIPSYLPDQAVSILRLLILDARKVALTISSDSTGEPK
jgi:hypothetical protein